MSIYVAKGESRDHWCEILKAWFAVQDQFVSQLGRAASSFDEPAATSILSAAVWRTGRAAICEPFAWKARTSAPNDAYLGRTDLWFAATEKLHEWVEAKSVWTNWRANGHAEIFGHETRESIKIQLDAASDDACGNLPDLYDEKSPLTGVTTAAVFFTAFSRKEDWQATLEKSSEIFGSLRDDEGLKPTFVGMHKLNVDQCAFEDAEDRWPCLSFLVGRRGE